MAPFAPLPADTHLAYFWQNPLKNQYKPSNFVRLKRFEHRPARGVFCFYRRGSDGEITPIKFFLRRKINSQSLCNRRLLRQKLSHLPPEISPAIELDPLVLFCIICLRSGTSSPDARGNRFGDKGNFRDDLRKNIRSRRR